MTDIIKTGAMAMNPAIGLAGVIAQRSGVLGGGKNLGEHLGKNLSHHQVIHAVNQARVSNLPRTDIGKAVLSSIGGNPRIVNQAITKVGMKTTPLAPFDRRALVKAGDHLKHSLSAVSIKSP